jgi:hypothetical protein
MHLKVFLKLKKTLKALSSGQIYFKKPKKPKKTKKTKKTKKPKKTHWVGFFQKNPGFFQPCEEGVRVGGVYPPSREMAE